LPEQLFAQADVDKDGVISPKEARDFFPKFAPVSVLRDVRTYCCWFFLTTVSNINYYYFNNNFQNSFGPSACPIKQAV